MWESVCPQPANTLVSTDPRRPEALEPTCPANPKRFSTTSPACAFGSGMFIEIGVRVRLTIIACSGGCPCYCFGKRFDSDPHNTGSRMKLVETFNQAMAEQPFASKLTLQLCVVLEMFPEEPNSFLKSVLLDLERITQILLPRQLCLEPPPIRFNTLTSSRKPLLGASRSSSRKGWAMRCSCTNVRVLWTSSA